MKVTNLDDAIEGLPVEQPDPAEVGIEVEVDRTARLLAP